MIWRLALSLLCAYLLFVAYRFYAHSQPVTAIDIRQQYIAQSDNLELAVVWPEGEDKEGYLNAVRLVLDRLDPQQLSRCVESGTAAQEKICRHRSLQIRYHPEATAGREQAVRQARNVADQLNTLAVLGYYRSDIAVPAATVYEHQGVLMLSSAASNLKLTSYDFRYIFRHAANDDANAEVLAQHIHEEGYTNVYVVYKRDLYGTDFSNYFIEHVTARGLKVPAQVYYEANEKDYLPMLASLRSKITSINLTDELALMLARVAQIKRIDQIRQLAISVDDRLIVQFLTQEQQKNKSDNKFFDSMSRVKLLDYLQLELDQSSAMLYLQQLFRHYQQELSLNDTKTQYQRLEQVEQEIRQLTEQLIAAHRKQVHPTVESDQQLNSRIVTRKTLDFDLNQTIAQLNQMLKRISRVKTGQVDAIFIADFMPDVAQVILQARSLGIELPIFAGHSLIDLNNNCRRLNNCHLYGDVSMLITHDTEEYQQVYARTQDPEQNCAGHQLSCIPKRYDCPEFTTAYQRFQEFATAYQQQYQAMPDNWAVQGYLAASIIGQTIAAAHSFDPEVLADTLLYQGNSEFINKGLMFSCSSPYISEGDVLVEGMKIRKLGKFQESN